MELVYDKYYQKEDYFGKAYSELLDFFEKQPKSLKILDLGCGQGRDSIPLARMGFEVKGIDNSKVGIDQLNKKAREENLKLKGLIANIYEYENYKDYNAILLDSMFHFTKNDRRKEAEFLKSIIEKCKSKTILVICIQDTGKKVEILRSIINVEELENICDVKMKYVFEDKGSNHKSVTNYRMIVKEKKNTTHNN